MTLNTAPRHFLVIGRIEGDDEDTPRTYAFHHDASVTEVRNIYAADMLHEYIEAAIESGEEPNLSTPVFINYVFTSDEPITECWNKWA